LDKTFLGWELLMDMQTSDLPFTGIVGGEQAHQSPQFAEVATPLV